jgi:hypothetical protein
MSAILHAFTNAPDSFQVNLTIGVNSYVRTCTGEELEHMLVTPAAFDDDMIRKVFDELAEHHKVTVTDVDIPEKLASALGFEAMPSDA